jgi:hypothetical protein
MKIRQVGTEFFHADQQTERYDETNNLFFRKRIKINNICDWKENINEQPEQPVAHKIFLKKIPNKFQAKYYH